jgi:hypothetical protein
MQTQASASRAVRDFAFIDLLLSLLPTAPELGGGSMSLVSAPSALNRYDGRAEKN